MARSEQFAELLNRKTGITNNTAERESIDGVVARDSQDAPAIRHDDMLPLTNDREACLLEGTHSIEVVDPWDLGQG